MKKSYEPFWEPQRKGVWSAFGHIGEVLSLTSNSRQHKVQKKNYEIFHAAFKVDFLENGSLIFLKLRTPVAHFRDCLLGENEKKN
jgi:hypothetical protein